MDVDGLDVDAVETHGEGGFLVVRRVTLRNRRSDGTHSDPYVCDFVTRPGKGLDAVAVVVYRGSGADLEVLVRRGLRPALRLGRTSGYVPEPEVSPSLSIWEVVAGILEPGDDGPSGIRARAAAEVWEEAGYRVAPDDIVTLGAPFYASPGSLCERVYAAAVQVPVDAAQGPLVGDGSPMEEGATTRWLPLDQAIAECVAGTIQDVKTEVLLRRLRDRLA